MKIKTSELIGEPLNYAVALVEYGSKKVYINPDIRRKGIWVIPQKNGGKNHFHPSKSHAQGGALMERERISLIEEVDGTWQASIGGRNSLDKPFFHENGPTQLIAAMRCYVASKLGDEVEIPEELLR
jgi:hypothetical protein